MTEWRINQKSTLKITCNWRHLREKRHTTQSSSPPHPQCDISPENKKPNTWMNTKYIWIGRKKNISSNLVKKKYRIFCISVTVYKIKHPFDWNNVSSSFFCTLSPTNSPNSKIIDVFDYSDVIQRWFLWGPWALSSSWPWEMTTTCEEVCKLSTADLGK